MQKGQKPSPVIPDMEFLTQKEQKESVMADI
jgi:hypothetical protein